MNKNKLEIIHSEFGIEEFEINKPIYNIYKSSDSWELVLYFKCDKAIKRSKKLEEIIDVKPNFEISFTLDDENLNLEKGTTFFSLEGYDYDKDEYLTNLYYFEHNTIDNLKLEVLEKKNNSLTVNIEGEAIINGSNGNKPDSKLKVVNLEFILDKKYNRTIM
ncbi:hypothetical protein [Aureivirga sp. CE67]|uniref:hypothetical protein n=1 Tax=Aureivirga sp. CE67 TaxID=1788983 RepID=UPI0018CA0F29|nr:hypothetical protein [Aureivirga sp. CE67]